MNEKEWQEILADMEREDPNASRRYRRYNLSLDWMGILSDDSEHDLDDLKERVAKAMDKLTWKQKRVLKLIFYHGYTQNETAKIMGCDPSAVRHLKRRALKTLKENLIK